MRKQKTTELDTNIMYQVNMEKKAVTCSVLAHGMRFFGISKCGPNDKFDEETGKAIAHMRATIEQRKYDLELTRNFINDVKVAMDDAYIEMGVVSPHYMRAIQTATEEMKAQEAHIRDLYKRINAYK